ncbi:MAG TPA: PDZ domain-containing protein [Planctomycetota bacterium]|nr:PDZ domain-containing protein [Planctomycetota bacterium]
MLRLLAASVLLVADVTPRGDLFRAESARAVGSIQVGKSAPACLGFSRDSRRLIVLSADNRLTVWDLGARRRVREIAPSFYSHRFALSADGTRALGPAPDRRSLRLFDLERGVQIGSYPDIAVQAQTFALSPDGRRVSAVSREQAVRILDAATGDEQKSLVGPGTGQAGCMAWSPDGKQVVVHGWDSTIRFFDAATGETTASCATTGQVPFFVGFSPDSATVVVVNQAAGIVLFDRAGRELRTLEAGLAGSRSIAFSPDGLLMAANDVGGKTRLWDAKTWRHLRDLETGPGRHLAFSPDGRYLAIAAVDGTVKFWGASGDFGTPAPVEGVRPGAPGYLGIFGNLTEDEEKGARVQSTVPGGPAEKAGVQAGDLIVKIGATPTESFEILRSVVSALREGDEIEVVYKREGVEKKVKVKLGARPPENE